MQRKSGFPATNCSIKIPDGVPVIESANCEEDGDQQQRKLQLINFGHMQWGFNNWNWSVTKQELDFVDFSNGKYCAGVVAFVSITVKTFDIHRENIGYATSVAPTKGLAIYRARKCAVTNALRETLLSFGGTVANELTEYLDAQKTECNNPPLLPEASLENNQNILNKHTEPKNSPLNKNVKKETSDSSCSNKRLNPQVTPAIKNENPLLVAKPQPSVSLPPAANRLPPPMPANAPRPPPPAAMPPPQAPQHLSRPNSNEASKPIESMSEEEARAERKRRQRQAQEEFKQKLMMKQGDLDNPELSKASSSFDMLLMDIPTQEIVIEDSTQTTEEVERKRKSPAPESSSKRRSSVNKLDILH